MRHVLFCVTWTLLSLASPALAGFTTTIEIYGKVGSDGEAAAPWTAFNAATGQEDAIRRTASGSQASLVGTGYASLDESTSRWFRSLRAIDQLGTTFPYDLVTYIQADLSEFLGQPISSATLEWYFESSSGDEQIEVLSIDTQGVIDEPSFNKLNLYDPPPAIPGQTAVYDTNEGYNSIDVTSMVRNRVDNNEQWLGLLMQNYGDSYQSTFSDASVANDGTLYNGSYDAAQMRLIVNYGPEAVVVPEATSIVFWSLIAGVVGAVALRRGAVTRATV